MHSHPPHNLTDRAPGPSLPGSRSLAPQTFLDVLSTALTASQRERLIRRPLLFPTPLLSYQPLLTLTPSPPLPRRPRQPRSWPGAAPPQPAPVPCWGVCVLRPRPRHAFPPVCCMRTREGGEDTPAPPKEPLEKLLVLAAALWLLHSQRDLASELRMLLALHPQGRQLFLRGGQI